MMRIGIGWSSGAVGGPDAVPGNGAAQGDSGCRGPPHLAREAEHVGAEDGSDSRLRVAEVEQAGGDLRELLGRGDPDPRALRPVAMRGRPPVAAIEARRGVVEALAVFVIEAEPDVLGADPLHQIVDVT